MAWDFKIGLNGQETYKKEMSVKPGDLLNIDNWINGKFLCVALDCGSFNTSTGLMEYKVLVGNEVKTIGDWQMRISEKMERK